MEILDGDRMMSERQRETAFLRECLLYDDTAERHKLEEEIARAQRNERSVHRAVLLMALLTLLALAGLCYATLFGANPRPNASQFLEPLIVKVLCALGLGSLICTLSFIALAAFYRRDLDERREECRRVTAKLLESRLGKPRPAASSRLVNQRKSC